MWVCRAVAHARAQPVRCTCAARQRHMHALVWCMCLTLFLWAGGHCEVTLLRSARCLARAAPDLHSHTSGWLVGEVVVQRKPRWLPTHTYVVYVHVCVVLHGDT